MSAELYVRERGAGTAIVFVHGIGGTGNVWEPQAALLSRRFRTLQPDLHGAARAKAGGPHTADEHAADLVALLDARGIDAAHFVGHSFGSNVGQRVAVQYPDRVRSLSLLGSGPGAGSPSGQQALRDRAARVREEGLEAVADETAQRATAALTSAARPVVTGFIREMVLSWRPEEYAHMCEAAGTSPGFDSARITVPTLLLSGIEDTTTPPAATARLHRQVAGSEVHYLAQCGHWHALERPDTVSELIAGFLLAQAG